MSSVGTEESENDDGDKEKDLEMLVDVTKKFANIAQQKKHQMSVLLLQQQEKFRDQLVSL